MPTVPSVTATTGNDIKTFSEFRFLKSQNRKRVEHVKHRFFHYKKKRKNIRAIQKTNVLQSTHMKMTSTLRLTFFPILSSFAILNSCIILYIFLYFVHSVPNFTKVSFQLLIWIVVQRNEYRFRCRCSSICATEHWIVLLQTIAFLTFFLRSTSKVIDWKLVTLQVTWQTVSHSGILKSFERHRAHE